MLIPEAELQRWTEGRQPRAWTVLGCNAFTADGREGLLFACWAPRARAVSVAGDFNDWDAARHPMQRRDPHGVWECFIPALAPGQAYKYAVTGQDGGTDLKSDPFARAYELRPNTASLIAPPSQHRWSDGDWLARRARNAHRSPPQSVYELHLGSWRRRPDGSFAGYAELAEPLARYVGELGFTHVELMPLMEHPLDASWGYQPIGLYAPTRRHGSADELRTLVDTLHAHGIGVILDWVPAHFPRDAHGLARFDGAPLFEHEDPRRGEHPDWGTLIYDFGRPQVRNFLVANALYWLQEFHFDGLRVDAVASLLYLDYSRSVGGWSPNRYGGRENLEAVAFLQELNCAVGAQVPGAEVIAEESTTWPGVTRPVHLGGLGFALKWNMGWMHDTLEYFRHDPVHRAYHHDRLTFGITYFGSERFALPLSHDEVVHGKAPLIYKMPGDDWQKFANLRLLFLWQWTYPGKKLLFMGGEFAQTREWNHERELDWPLLRHAPHLGVQRLVGDLNRLYRAQAPLHADDHSLGGFEWIDCHDAAQSIVSFQRRDPGGGFVVVLLNFTPVVRRDYRIGVPGAGRYAELLNTDSAHYGGSNVGNAGIVRSEAIPWMAHPHSLRLSVPPLGGLVLQLQPEPASS